MILAVPATRCSCEDGWGGPLDHPCAECNGYGWVLPEHVVVPPCEFCGEAQAAPGDPDWCVHPSVGSILAAVKKCPETDVFLPVGEETCRCGGTGWLVVGVYGVVTEARIIGQCRECGFYSTELTGEARKGGGYHVRCPMCKAEWDDPRESHGRREDHFGDTVLTWEPILHGPCRNCGKRLHCADPMMSGNCGRWNHNDRRIRKCFPGESRATAEPIAPGSPMPDWNRALL